MNGAYLAGNPGRIVIPLLLFVVAANVWDNYDSLTLGIQLKVWIAEGNPEETFFPSYDFHETIRGLARLSLYFVSGCISLLL